MIAAAHFAGARYRRKALLFFCANRQQENNILISILFIA
jgi:hypothetical protein